VQKSEQPPQPGMRSHWQLLRATLPELLRFGAVGVASAVVYFILYGLFEWLTPFPPSVLATLAYGTGMIFNYLVQRSFTFRSQRQHHHAGPRYVLVQIGGLLINTAVIYVGVDRWRWPFLPVQLGAIVLTATWNYLGQKFWAFDGPRRHG
jgi:putative flippase GtrA